MRVAGRALAVGAIGITAVAALFCIIGLATKGWYLVPFGSVGLFCDGCLRAPAALSIISFILLIVSVVTLIMLMLDVFRGVLRYIPILILFIASFFLLAAFTSSVEKGMGYSFDLMVVAHFFSYVAVAIVAYWLGQTDAASD